MKEDSGRRQKTSKIRRHILKSIFHPESCWNLLISPKSNAQRGTHSSEPFETVSRSELKTDLGAFSTSPREAHLSIQAKPELNPGQGCMPRKSDSYWEALFAETAGFLFLVSFVGCCATSKKYPWEIFLPLFSSSKERNPRKTSLLNYLAKVNWQGTAA